MELKKVNLKDIKPSEYNPREISKEAYDNLKANIKEFGFLEPLVLNKDLVIIGGHQRYKALKELGYKEAEVIILDLPKEKEKILNISLNKISGDWDYDKLGKLIGEIDKGIDLTGFTDEELIDLKIFQDEDYKKDNFINLIDKFTQKKTKAHKNENWFYIEFYNDKKTFEALSKVIKFNKKTAHEIDPEWFKKLITAYAKGQIKI